MPVDLNQYRDNARANGMCADYERAWDNCCSLKQIFDMALGVKAIDFLCDSIAKGWGLSPNVISERFSGFLNGRYVSHQKGYDSVMYCMFKGNMVAKETAICVISSDMDVHIPISHICEIYACKGSKIRLHGPGKCIVVCYGDEKDVEVSGDCKSWRRINKKNRDANG